MRQASLDTVAQIEYGTRVTKKKDGGSAYPVYGGGGATFSLDSWNRENCFIVSRFAMSKECVRYVEGKFFLNDSGLTVSTLDEEVLSQRYLDNFLLARSRQIYGLSRGTAQRNLDMPAFRSLRVPLAPLDEQKRIVAKLDQAQSKLDRLESKLDLQLGAVDGLERAALNQEIAVSRVEQGNTCSASELAVSRWPAVPLGSVVTILGGGTPSKAEKSFWNGPIPWASVRDLKDRWLTSTEFQISEQAIRASASRIVPAGNVVICTRVGLGKVVQARFDLAINQDLKGLIPKEPTVLDPNFVFYWYKSIAGRVIAMGTGATVQGVRLDDISSLLVPLPPLDEQKRIVAKLDAVQQELAALRERLYERRSLALSFRDRTLAAALVGDL